MTLAQNYNPYYNDFNPEKDFLQILFKPGVPVQARELTQLQSILQNQISKFAGYLFENGNAITGAGVDVDIVSYFSYNPIYQNSSVNISSHKGLAFTSGSNISGTIVDYNDSEGLIYVDYNTGSATLAAGNVLTTSAGSFALQLNSQFETGDAYRVCVGAGVYFINDRFVELESECIIPVARGLTFDGYVGIDFTESIITTKEDKSLYDPAKGTYNYAGPGADRLTYVGKLKYFSGTGSIDGPCLVDFSLSGAGFEIKSNTPFLNGPDYTQVSVTQTTSGIWEINVSGNTNATTPYQINMCDLDSATLAELDSGNIELVGVIDNGAECLVRKISIANLIPDVPTVIDAICLGTAPANPAVGSYWLDTSSEPFILRKRTSSGWTDIPASTLHPLTIVRCASGEVFDIINDLFVVREVIEEFDVCAVAPATASEITNMTADPSTMKLAVCHDDGTPSMVGISGSDLSTILGLGGGAGLSLLASDIAVFGSGSSNGGTVTLPAGRWLVIGTVGDISLSSNNAYVGPWEVPPTYITTMSQDASFFTPIFYGIGQGGAGISLGTAGTHTGAFSAIRIRLQ